MDDMSQVREGMMVVDRSGQEVGTIEDLKEGDPEAVTSEGQAPDGGNSLVGDVAEALGTGADVPQQFAERMLRIGYIKIDSKGLFRSDCYAAADRLDRVEGGVVHLNIDSSELIS
ncbi:hypothetical protein [Arthrobacter castelli]|uniref:hypothetical protein n=1 Tax=Arthrobacter castelli TaxID=271431 RepID=UPI0004243636|nr:hypothetical protein [Arthrobacter castelli]